MINPFQIKMIRYETLFFLLMYLTYSGLKQLGWLIGRNDTSWYNSLTSTSKLPPGMTVPKEDILTSLVTSKIEITTPMPMATNNIGNNSQVLGVIGKIQGIVASAQKESDEDMDIEINDYSELDSEKDTNESTVTNIPKLTSATLPLSTMSTTVSTRKTYTEPTSIRKTSTIKMSTKGSSTVSASSKILPTKSTTLPISTTGVSTLTTSLFTMTTSTPTRTKTTTSTASFPSSTTLQNSFLFTKSTLKTTKISPVDLFEINLFSDIKPWKYVEEPSPSDDSVDTIDNEPDPFEDMFDLSMLKPQSPFLAGTSNLDTTEMKLQNDKNKSLESVGNLTIKDDTTPMTSSTESSITTTPTTRSTTLRTTARMKVVNGFIVGNSDKSSKKQYKDNDNSWSWVDFKTNRDESLEKTSSFLSSGQYKNQETIKSANYDITTPKLQPHKNNIHLGTVEYIPNINETPSNLAMILAGKIKKPQTKVMTQNTETENVGTESRNESTTAYIKGSVEIVPKSMKELLLKTPRRTVAKVVQIKNPVSAFSNNHATLNEQKNDMNLEKNKFIEINNDIGFEIYKKLSVKKRNENMIFSPFSALSSLAMLFLGARSSTSWQINEIMKMDEITSFNPHILYKDVLSIIGENNNLLNKPFEQHLLLSEVK